MAGEAKTTWQGKRCAQARQAVKNGRRVKRHGRKSWMRGQAVMKEGPGGTDKSGSRKRSLVYYSDRPASR